jgi:serine/threonine protein kinase
MTVCDFAFRFFSTTLDLGGLPIAVRLIENLGGGAAAHVLLMEHKEKKIQCAVKRISKPTAKELKKGKTWKSDWKKDVEKLAALKSPFIVQTYDAFEDDLYAYIVMEYCESGDLSYLMHLRTVSMHTL